MDLSKILAGAGVSNEVVTNPGEYDPGEGTTHVTVGKIKNLGKRQINPGIMYPLGIRHAKQLFYTVWTPGEVIVKVESIKTFEDAKLFRDALRETGNKAAICISVLEVDY